MIKRVHTARTPFAAALFAFFVALAAPTAPAAAESTDLLPPPRHGGVYVVAHRGAHEDRPENTLAAYQRAIDLGADYVEIDVRTTKDGHLVSVHNRTVDAYTDDAKGNVADFTLAELKALDIGSRVDPKWKEERIPTFEEILALCKGKIGIYLDLKEADIATVFQRVEAHGMLKSVLWYCNAEQHRYVMANGGISMPDPGPEDNLAALIAEFQPKIVASVWRHYSPTFVKTCHDAGALVIVDESDPSCWEDAVAWGSDGIQTDHPEKLIAWLKARGN
ncbi:MAG: glycerophosphodiester phosphodiesterase family protein [Candidatus Hydrogenedentes bacterium]|nr:glycerophosphodiester phosphodiesterase family protein [Candidatus Hydrogenedentota bacterium]